MTSSAPSFAPPGASSRAWLGTLVVLAIAAFHAYGLPALSRSLPGTAPQPAGVTVDLGHGVSVVTPADWSAEITKMNPGETLALVNDASSLVATTFAWEGSEAEMIDRLRLLFESTRHFHLRGTPEPFRTAAGVSGNTIAIYGQQADGRVWIGQLPNGKFGFAVRVRSVPGQGERAMSDAAAVVASLRIKEAK